MANPQTEDGYTRIANEILEALISHRLAGQEFQIVLYIIRKTYGFNKKCDFISMSQIAKATGIKRSLVARILKNLKEKHVIGVTQNDNSFVNCLYFSKDYERWKVLHKKITVLHKKITLLPKKVIDSRSCEKGVTQNDNSIEISQNDVKGVTQNDAHKRKNTNTKKEERIHIVDKFVKPTIEEITSYCQERNNSVTPQAWLDHYISNGWKVGKNPMKDWQAAVRTWEHRKEKEEKYL